MNSETITVPQFGSYKGYYHGNLRYPPQCHPPTPNKWGLIKGIPRNGGHCNGKCPPYCPQNSGLGSIVICPDYLPRFIYFARKPVTYWSQFLKKTNPLWRSFVVIWWWKDGHKSYILLDQKYADRFAKVWWFACIVEKTPKKMSQHVR